MNRYLVTTNAGLAGITQANAIYIIRNDLTLSSTLNMPANCILEFDGGSISGGTINCNNTRIVASDDVIFDDVILTGTIVGDLVLNHFKHTADCVQSARNIKASICVKGNVTIDEPIHIFSDMRIYGYTDMTNISLSDDYDGPVKAIIILDGGDSGVLRSAVEGLSFLNADYAIYRNKAQTVISCRFDNLRMTSTIRKSAFHIESGWGCNTISNLRCNDMKMGNETWDPEGDDPNCLNNYGSIIFIKGSWCNWNRFEHCDFQGKAESAIKISCPNQWAECQGNHISDCWFEYLYIKKDIIVVNAPAETASITDFTVSKCWIERIFDYSEYGSSADVNTLKRQGFASFDTHIGRKVNTVKFESNTFSQFIKYIINLNHKMYRVYFENNNISPINGGKINMIVEGGDNQNGSKFIALNNDDFNLSTSQLYAGNLIDIVSKLSGGSVANQLHTKTFNFTLDTNESKTINLIPDSMTNKGCYWSDIQICSVDKHVTLGKLLYKYVNEREYTFQQTFTNHEHLTISNIDDAGNITLTNDSTINEYYIGVIAMSPT